MQAAPSRRNVAELIDVEQSFRRGAQVGDRLLFLRRTIDDRANAGAELGGPAPNPVFALLNDVGHVNDTSQESSIALCLVARSGCGPACRSSLRGGRRRAGLSDGGRFQVSVGLRA